MARRVLALITTLALTAPSSGALPRSRADQVASGPAIDHAPLKCIVENEHAHVRAAVAAVKSVERSRVYFKAHQYPDWYYIEMEAAELPRYLGVLPQPLPGTERVDYYLYALDLEMQSGQTAEYDPEVAPTCRRDAGAWIPGAEAAPSITVHATKPGQPPIPPGFAAAGIVAFVSADGETLTGTALAEAALAAVREEERKAAAAILPGSATSSAPDPDTGAASAASPAPAVEAPGPRRKRSVLPFVLGGIGVAGIAAVVGGGSNDNPGVTPAPAPSAAPSVAPTPSPTPTPACGFQARPSAQSFPAAGGSGTCTISTAPECSWTAQSSVPWIQLKGSKADTGPGSVRFDVAKNNTGEGRRGFVWLRDNEGVRCQIDQAQGGYVPPVALVWVSELAVPDGVGRVFVNGVPSPLQSARSQAAAAARPGRNRVEAELISGSQPGVWRFRVNAALAIGSLHVERGALVGQSEGLLVFRLRGEPGERIAFSFELAREH